MAAAVAAAATAVACRVPLACRRLAAGVGAGAGVPTAAAAAAAAASSATAMVGSPICIGGARTLWSAAVAQCVGGAGPLGPATPPAAATAATAPVAVSAAGPTLEGPTVNGESGKVLADDLGAKPDEKKSEVKDAKLIFELVWNELVAARGLDKMTFPRTIVWLSGAPGAGKGTMNGFIMRELDISTSFEVSSLLVTPEMQRLKATGTLIGDKEVLRAVLEKLLRPECANGVVVDGFPRTVLQAQAIKLLYDQLMDVWQESRTNVRLRGKWRRPVFSICVLYVDEDESVKRQLKRGKEIVQLNKMIADTGVGLQRQLRDTDTSEASARKRYRVFKDEVYGSLQAIKGVFDFHFVNAGGTFDEVKERIMSEFAYQSSLDLAEDTYELVRAVEPASALIRNARVSMVNRLNSYATEHRALFESCVELINHEFMHILKRQALMGAAVIRSNNVLLDNPVAINMVLDVLAERGYSVILDVARSIIPARIERLTSAESTAQIIVPRIERNYIFRITFPKPEIRRIE